MWAVIGLCLLTACDMPTRFYIAESTAPGYAPASYRGGWDDTTYAVSRALLTAKAPTEDYTYLDGNEGVITNPWSVLLLRAVSDPLPFGVVIEGTLNLNFQVWSYWGDQRTVWHLHAYVTQGDSDDVRGVLLDDYLEDDDLSNQRWPNNTTRTWYTHPLAADLVGAGVPQALSSVSAVAGDRIVIEIGGQWNNSYAGFNPYGSIRYGAPEDDDLSGVNQALEGDKVGWLEFSGDLFPASVFYACGAPAVGEDLCAKRNVLSWIEWDLDASTTMRYSAAALDDPAAYYGGPKAPRILNLGPVTRALSDFDGQWEAARFTVELADTDRQIRDYANTTPVRGTALRAYLVSAEGRALGTTPRVLWAGPLIGWTPTGDLRMELHAGDQIARVLGGIGGRPERQIPTRTVTVEDFPNAPAAALGRTVPIIYGYQSNSRADETTSEGVCPLLYVGTRNLSGAASAILELSPEAAPEIVDGSHLTGYGTTAFHHYRWIYVTAVDSNGKETVCSNPSHIEGHLFDGDSAAFVGWMSSPDAQSYRVYCTNCYNLGVPNGFDPRNPIPPLANRYFPLDVPPGESVETEVQVFFKTKDNTPNNGGWPPGSPHDHEITYLNETDGTNYLTDVAGTWHEFLLCGHAVSSIEALSVDNGAPVTTFGTEWLVPGETDWATASATVYRDFNGRRYTVIYGKGTDADACAGVDLNGTEVTPTKVLFASVKGIEETGDGSGALITDVYKQYVHWLINWGLQDYQSGGWLDMTTGPLYLAAVGSPEEPWCVINVQSWLDASTLAQLRIAGGYEGVAYFGFDYTRGVRDCIADWNVSCDARLGLNEFAQWTLTLLPDNVDATTLEAFSDVVDIHESSVTLEVDADGLVGDVRVFSWRVPKLALGDGGPGWDQHYPKQPGTSVSIRDAENAWDEVVLAYADATAQASCDPLDLGSVDLYLPFVQAAKAGERTSETANDVAQRWLARRAAPEIRVTFRTGLCGLRADLGDVIKVTHFAGMTSAGWVNRLVQVERLVIDASAGTVTVTGRDVSRFVQASIRSVAGATIRVVGLAPTVVFKDATISPNRGRLTFGPLAPTVTQA